MLSLPVRMVLKGLIIVSDAGGNHLYCFRTLGTGMSEETARLTAAVKERDGNYQQAWERAKRRNQEVDWDVERMLPEVFDGENRERVVSENATDQ